MQANSSPVESLQEGPHPSLARTVRRHLEHPWRRPLGVPTRQVWERLEPLLRERVGGGHEAPARPVRTEGAAGLILDSGCGNGESCFALARLHPGCWVLGVDKSLTRLERGIGKATRGGGSRAELADSPIWIDEEARVLLVRADLEDLWPLLLGAALPIRRHYLLYPNPWPRPEHLKRRWHGHPAFAVLRQLCAEVELHTNWRIYAEEFAEAWAIAEGVARRGAGGAPEPVREVERIETRPGEGEDRLGLQGPPPALS